MLAMLLRLNLLLGEGDNPIIGGQNWIVQFSRMDSGTLPTVKTENFLTFVRWTSMVLVVLVVMKMT